MISYKSSSKASKIGSSKNKKRKGNQGGFPIDQPITISNLCLQALNKFVLELGIMGDFKQLMTRAQNLKHKLTETKNEAVHERKNKTWDFRHLMKLHFSKQENNQKKRQPPINSNGIIQ